MPLTIVWSLVYIGVGLFQPNYVRADYTEDPRYKACVNNETSSRCICIIDTSDALEDNNKVLDIYLNSKDAKSAAKKILSLIDSNEYSYHVFRSRKDRSEFVRGKVALFLAEVRRKCG